MKSILILYSKFDGKCTTGGQVYEENMYNCMIENPDIEVERFGINRDNSFFNKLFSPVLNLTFIRKCRKHNIVIFNSSKHWHFIPLSFLLSLFSNTRVMIIHHHFMHLEFSGFSRLFYQIIENLFLKTANHIITVSPYIYDICKKKFRKHDVRLWPIPFSHELIKQSNKTEDSNNLIYIGTIEPRKGLIYLLQSLTIIKQKGFNFKLDIIGKIKNQRYYDELCTYIKANDLNVKFHGFVKSLEKDQMLKEASIFVFPSLLEGYGMVLSEVMAFGLPIVCFNNSAMPYLVKTGKNGIVVANKDYRQMAEAISSILIDPNLRRQLSEGSYSCAKKTITYNEYKTLLKEELKVL